MAQGDTSGQERKHCLLGVYNFQGIQAGGDGSAHQQRMGAGVWCRHPHDQTWSIRVGRESEGTNSKRPDLVALGIPWMLSIHAHGEPIKVTNSQGLSIIIGALRGCFILQSLWTLTKGRCEFGKVTGGVHASLYVLFTVYCFLNDELNFTD